MARECWVVGPPGTGKTTTLSEQVRKAAAVVGAENILVCSFTRSAAREIASREIPLARRQVGTLHAHAWRALRMPRIIDRDEKAIKEFFEKTGFDPAAAFGQTTMGEAYSLGRNTGNQALLEATAAFGAAWTEFKQEQDVMDFTDLLENALAYCDHAPGDPAVLFVDEAQDSTPLQWRLLRKWGEAVKHSFVLFGDPDQCIYAWAGASPDSMTLAAGARCDSRVVLHQSHRVPRAVHTLAESIIAQVSVRDPAPYAPRPADGEVRREFEGYATSSRGIVRPVDGVVRLVQDLLLEHDGTVLVLAQCAYQLDPLLSELRAQHAVFANPYRADPRWNPLGDRRGVLASLGAWESLVTGRDAVTALPGALSATLAEAGDEFSDDEPFGGSSPDAHIRAAELEAVARGGNGERQRKAEKGGESLSLDALLETLKPLKRTAFQRGGVALFEELAGDAVSRAAMPPLTWGGVATFLGDDSAQRLRALDTAWYRDSALASSAQRVDYLTGVVEHHGWDALRVEPRLRVGTVHSVKGGEADTVVYLQGCSPQAMRGLVEGGASERDAMLRTLYVACTRARERLVIVGADRYAALGVPEL